MSNVRQRKQQKMAACVGCRQMKLKCDGNEKFPAPCTRCATSDLNCHVDPLFKRTAKRERLNVVERQLREIKDRLDAPRTSPLPDVSPRITESVSTTSTQSPIENDPSVVYHALQQIRIHSGPRSLNGVELVPDQVADLVEHYFVNYHPQFPILPDIASFRDYSANEDLLFWTVVTIALRNKLEYRSIYLVLAESVRLLACDIARSGLPSLQSIQSLLLLCCWPPPFGPSIDDPSSTFVSLASSSALRLGLHRPRFVSEYEYKLQLDDFTLVQRRRTWICCFIINFYVCSYMGIPSLVQPDHSILEAVATQPQWLPDTLFFQLQIARQGRHIDNTLGNYDLSASGLLPNPTSYIRSFDAELRLLEAEYRQRWSKHDFITFLQCKLILYGFGTMAPDDPHGVTKDQSGYQDRLSTHHWTQQAYVASLGLIQSAVSLKESFLFTTIHTQRWIANATAYLLRLLVYPQEYEFDETIIRNGINQGWQLLKACSMRENDQMSRATAVITYLSSESLGTNPVKKHDIVRTRSKMGANMYADMVTIARDRFAQHIQVQRPKDCTGAAADEEAQAQLNELSIDSIFSGQYTEDWASFLQNI
ncbi:hypothetical protein BDV96DRAFT_298868 [Lophiotrema nucula]|uniref:Zn(2)-C6 fungal-type domain-containing protein n=1 Tax=Lophiotrema nucula TaxID=690887 RepID=A0A6A5YL01_9PLEO|nr:hypothetical protein BDV96DRAFT_298868 [Lophiotrema nucula]